MAGHSVEVDERFEIHFRSIIETFRLNNASFVS